MPRRFNTAGPCKPDLHYMVPPLARLCAVRRLIENQAYFVVHAPRQVGKTTSFLSLASELTREGRTTSALVSMVAGSPTDDIGAAELAILRSWRTALEAQLPQELLPPSFPDAPPGSRVASALGAWAHASSRPLVLFLDEIDSLSNNVLLSVLRQLHGGYPFRPKAFPSSIALIGLRDVRDYKVSVRDRERLGTASPFNIKERSLTLPNFTRDEVLDLYAQHTAETGQPFEPGVIDRVYELTEGQPWLVNALAQEMVEQIVPDPSKRVAAGDVDAAKETLFRRRDTHFDSLAERLRDDRARQVIEPMLAGGVLSDMPEDDMLFAIDLGLVRQSPAGTLEIANPIYAELIPRYLARRIQASMGAIHPIWLSSNGALDPDKLLEGFLAFWRQHGEALMGASPYHEVAPHLVMMAFLHRVENGGGKLRREFAIGSGRLDLVLEYGATRLPIELKVWRPKQSDPLKEGLAQIDDYLNGLGLKTGWLVIFDRRPNAKRLDRRTEAKTRKTPSGRRVTVIRA
jgi:hypothetical protein